MSRLMMFGESIVGVLAHLRGIKAHRPTLQGISEAENFGSAFVNGGTVNVLMRHASDSISMPKANGGVTQFLPGISLDPWPCNCMIPE
jgi:hypothetical protein